MWVYVFACMTSVNWAGAGVTHIVDSGNNERGVKRERSRKMATILDDAKLGALLQLCMLY